jgi:hypothetical protein
MDSLPVRARTGGYRPLKASSSELLCSDWSPSGPAPSAGTRSAPGSGTAAIRETSGHCPRGAATQQSDLRTPLPEPTWPLNVDGKDEGHPSSIAQTSRICRQVASRKIAGSGPARLHGPTDHSVGQQKRGRYRGVPLPAASSFAAILRLRRRAGRYQLVVIRDKVADHRSFGEAPDKGCRALKRALSSEGVRGPRNPITPPSEVPEHLRDLGACVRVPADAVTKVDLLKRGQRLRVGGGSTYR